MIGDELYMLKLSNHVDNNPNLPYDNSCISEYLGRHIFSLLGIDSQETIPDKLDFKGKERIAVACKDFEKYGYKLVDFVSVKNRNLDSNSNGYGTDINDVIETIESQKFIDPVKLSNYFWDMFVIDALLGNWNRHNGNWGFLYNQETDDVKIAPVFDCASCLFPQIDEETAKKILKDKAQLNARIYDFPTSALSYKGKRINYYNFIKSHEWEECDKAINRLKEKIDLYAIMDLIDSIDFLKPNHKEFLKIIIRKRYDSFFN